MHSWTVPLLPGHPSETCRSAPSPLPPALSVLQWEPAPTAGPWPGEEGGASGPHGHGDHGRRPWLSWATSALQAPGRGAPLGAPPSPHSALAGQQAPGCRQLFDRDPRAVADGSGACAPGPASPVPHCCPDRTWAKPREAPAEMNAAVSCAALPRPGLWWWPLVPWESGTPVLTLCPRTAAVSRATGEAPSAGGGLAFGVTEEPAWAPSSLRR